MLPAGAARGARSRSRWLILWLERVLDVSGADLAVTRAAQLAEQVLHAGAPDAPRRQGSREAATRQLVLAGRNSRGERQPCLPRRGTTPTGCAPAHPARARCQSEGCSQRCLPGQEAPERRESLRLSSRPYDLDPNQGRCPVAPLRGGIVRRSGERGSLLGRGFVA
jgi:hypothetical protein